MATTNISSSGVLGFNDTTGAVQLPSGTTAERPVSPSNGEMRYNTTDNKVEYYDGVTWIQFTDEATNLYDVDFLLIAGGGAGGPDDRGGGGGAGGLRTSYGTTSGGGCAAESASRLEPGTVYTITVGAGGTGTFNGYPTSNGDDSSISGSGFTTLTSTGGGRGGGFSGTPGTPNIWYGQAGGSSGGGSGASSWPAGTPVTCQGYSGGNGSAGQAGGGGGGAGGAGFAGTGTGQYVGAGAFLANSITGASVNYALGGNGSSGSMPYIGKAPSGAANTGGGGTGAGRSNNHVGNGGSGIAILRMPTANYSGTTTGSPTVTTDGSDTILSYTGSGTYTG